VLAGLYRSARVALVTPLRDGMNLVAKEFVAAQDADDPGVLILSRFAGAAAEFHAALLVNPHDPEAVGAAIERALTMNIEERRQRHAALFRVISDNDIHAWGQDFLIALEQSDVLPGARLPSDPERIHLRRTFAGAAPRDFLQIVRNDGEQAAQRPTASQ
jgi:trehalose 6-phosphate synthase